MQFNRVELRTPAQPLHSALLRAVFVAASTSNLSVHMALGLCVDGRFSLFGALKGWVSPPGRQEDMLGNFQKSLLEESVFREHSKSHRMVSGFSLQWSVQGTGCETRH